VAEAEERRRQLLRLPPATALAVLSGPEAADLAARLPPGVESSPVAHGGYLVRAASSAALADALASLVAHEPAGWGGIDARVEVDPLSV
jgi:hypothetical protein